MRLRRATRGKVAAKQTDKTLQRDGMFGRGIVGYWVRTVAGVGLVLILAMAAGVALWIDKAASDSRRKLESCTGMLVRDLAYRASTLQEQLRALSTHPQLQQALRSGDAGSLLASEAQITRLIPGALRVRLVASREDRSPDDPDAQALSYAGLDLIHQAERAGQVTLLEVHRLGQADMHLAMAGPVRDEAAGRVLGVVHVSLPLSLLPSTQELAGDQVRFLLQQHVGKEGAEVDSAGYGSMPQRPPDYSADVPATRLRVVAWIARPGLFEEGLLWYALGAYAVLLTLLASVLWVSFRGIKRALVADYGGLIDIVTDGINAGRIRKVRCRLAETQPMVQILSQMLRERTQAGIMGVKALSGRDEGARAERPAGPGAEAVEDRRAAVSAEHVASEAHGSQAPTPAPPQAEPGPDKAAAGRDMDRGAAAAETREPPGPLVEVPARVFRAYDIRGIVGHDLTAALARYVGLAVGSELPDGSERRVSVARDTRPSGVELCEALARGLRETGCDVIDLGVVPTPLLYFATRFEGDASGVMVTGSHNPPEYNGLKVVIDGVALERARLTELRDRIQSGGFPAGEGNYRVDDLAPIYIDYVVNDVAIARSMKVVIDCGNGAASVLAPNLYRALHCDVVELNCDLDAGFPEGRVPDPSRPECLSALQERVVKEEADLGLAFDGDGDRLGVVDSSGKAIWTDRVLMLLAADVLSRNPGTDVVFDVKCSRYLADEILRNGGRPVMWRSGHSPLKAKLRETGALLGGEWSGHIVFQERWFGFDDALYAGARLLEVLALDPRTSAEVFAALPEALSTPELILPLADDEAELIMHTVLALAERIEGVDVQTIDGLRANIKGGWGLVRASNTRPALTFRFEADDASAMEELKDLFRDIMDRAAPGLELPF